MRTDHIIVVLSLVLVAILVSGQGCEMPSFGGGGTGAKKTGIDYSLTSGIDYLTSGKTLQQGEDFYVGVHIENYDKTARAGQVCINDNIADSFGGISSQGEGECQFFNVRAADIVKKEVSGLGGKQIVEQLNPGTSDIYFPQGQPYSYSGLPSLLKPYEGVLTVSLRYRQTSQATATLTVPSAEQPSLSQEPAPIKISATQSAHKTQEGYKVNLDVLLVKSQQMKVFSADFSKENVTYFSAEIVPQTMSCSLTTGEPVQGLVSIENERLIKCSSLVQLDGQAQQSYPLVITLDYGVDIVKTYPFGIETKTT